MVAASGVGGTFLARGFSQCWWDQTPRPPDKNGYIHTTHTHKQKSLYLSWSWSLVWLNNDAKTLLPTTFIPQMTCLTWSHSKRPKGPSENVYVVTLYFDRIKSVRCCILTTHTGRVVRKFFVVAAHFWLKFPNHAHFTALVFYKITHKSRTL